MIRNYIRDVNLNFTVNIQIIIYKLNKEVHKSGHPPINLLSKFSNGKLKVILPNFQTKNKKRNGSSC